MSRAVTHRSGLLYALYNLMNPMPFGFFVATLIYDIVYNQTQEILWAKMASWTMAIGLVIAIIPRFINLFYVWFRPIVSRQKTDRIGFWLYALAIVIEIINAFVHSRDAFGIAPTNVILSAIVVVLIGLHYLISANHSNGHLAGDLS